MNSENQVFVWLNVRVLKKSKVLPQIFKICSHSIRPHLHDMD